MPTTSAPHTVGFRVTLNICQVFGERIPYLYSLLGLILALFSLAFIYYDFC